MHSSDANAPLISDPDWENVEPGLESDGIPFYEGCFAIWNAKKRVLRIRNTQENLDLLSSMSSDIVQPPTMVEKVSHWISDKWLRVTY